MTRPIASVVIPAHDEGAVVDRCLGALLEDAAPGEFEVVLVANGCTDDTVSRARAHGAAVRVLDLPAAGKTGALNAGDRAATVFPRLYLDADVVLPSATAREMADLLAVDEARVGGAQVHVDLSRSSRWVRSYYRVWTTLPVMRTAYVGSGVFGVSEAGHDRLLPFPDVVADDAYARRSFRADERVVASGKMTVFPPVGLRGVVRRGVRVHAGNDALPGQRSTSSADLVVDQVPRGMRGVLQARAPVRDKAVYLVVTTLIKAAARWRVARGQERTWSRDDSSRVIA